MSKHQFFVMENKKSGEQVEIHFDAAMDADAAIGSFLFKTNYLAEMKKCGMKDREWAVAKSWQADVGVGA